MPRQQSKQRRPKLRSKPLDAKIHGLVKEIEIADAKLQDSRRTRERRREEVSALRMRLQGLTERLSVLQDLERRQEGISGGVRTILEQLRDSSLSLAKNLHGIVAERLEVDVKVAPLIDAALGDRSQYVIVTGGELQKAILDGAITINSRVGLIRLDELPSRRPGDRIRLDGLKGVIGRGDRMIKCEPMFEPLAKHLLSSTWLVDSLETALGLRKLSGAGLRFVTAGGELLENDGSTVVGPAASASGLVSRKSELATAKKSISHYQYQLREAEEETGRLAARVDEETAQLGRLEQRHRNLIAERAAADAERRHIDQRRDGQRVVCEEIEEEILAIASQREAAHQDYASFETQITDGRKEIERLELEAADVEEMLSESQTALQTATSGVMAISVDVARAEQKFEALSTTMEQQRRDQGQREAAVEEVRQLAADNRVRIDELTARVLDATSRLSTLQWDADQSSDQLKALAQKAADVRRDNRDIMKASEKAMKEVAAASEAVHAITSRRDNTRIRRDTLAERLLEDYQIDLQSSEPPEDWQPPEDRDQTENEITHLRGQLQKTSNVNMEALEELEGLQQRYDQLHGQYQDLERRQGLAATDHRANQRRFAATVSGHARSDPFELPTALSKVIRRWSRRSDSRGRGRSARGGRRDRRDTARQTELQQLAPFRW